MVVLLLIMRCFSFHTVVYTVFGYSIGDYLQRFGGRVPVFRSCSQCLLVLELDSEKLFVTSKVYLIIFQGPSLEGIFTQPCLEL